MPGKTLPFRLYAQILIFFGLVALGAVILWPLQRAIQQEMTAIRDGLITRLEQYIDRKIQYSSISPSIFGSFDVRNVRIMGEDEYPVLTMSRFRIAYSLIDLLRGRPQGLHSVWIDTPLINFNVARDHDLLDLFENWGAGENGSRGDFSALFPEKFIARIRNGKCLIINGRDQYEWDASNVNIEIDERRLILDGIWTVGEMVDNPVGAPISIHVAMRANGSFRTDMSEGEAMFSIPSITGDAFTVSPIAFGLVLENEIIRLGKMPDQLLFGFFLEYGINDGKIDARLDCTNFSLGDFLSFSGGLEGARPFLDIAGSGTAFFERRHDGTLDYSADLSGAAMSHHGYPFAPFAAVPRASFAIKAAGNEDRAHIETLHFSMPQAAAERENALFFGDINFSGSVGLEPFAPEGVLSLGNFSLSGAESLDADIVIRAGDDDINLECAQMRMGSVTLGDCVVALRPARRDFDFSLSVRRFEDEGSIALEGSFNGDAPRVTARLRLDSFSAGDIAGMALPFTSRAALPLPVKGILDNTAIDTDVFFTTDFSEMAYNAPHFVFAGGMGRGFEGFISLSGTNRHFELDDGRFIWGEDTLTLSGNAQFAPADDIAFAMNAWYRDSTYQVEGSVRDGKTVHIQGSHGLSLELISSGQGYRGSLGADDFPVPFLGHPALLSVTAQLRYDAVDSWSMLLEQFELTDIAAPEGLARVRISGVADQNGARFPLLYFEDHAGPLSGRADIAWMAGYSGLSGDVSMGEGQESYRVQGSITGRGGSFTSSGSSMRLDRLLGGKVNLRADASMRLSWDDDADYFQAVFDLPAVHGKLHDQEFAASARFTLDKQEFIIDGLNVRFAGLEGTMPYFMLSGAQGIAETTAIINGDMGGRPVAGSLSLAAYFPPIRSWFEAGEITRSFSGAIQVDGFTYGDGEPEESFAVTFSRSQGAFAVSGGPREMIRFRMDKDGNFYGGLSSPFPVRGTIIGSVHQRVIDARCADLYVDMGELFNLLPGSANFYLTGGYVSASVDIRGSITDPEFFGSARLTSLRIRVPRYVTAELRPIPFTVVIDGNEMRFGQVATAVGSGAGTIAGWFRIDRWIPNIFNLDIAIPHETPIPYGVDISGFVARGDASGTMAISMENQTFSIMGNLTANNTEMSVNADELQPRGERSFAQTRTSFVVDLTITTGPVAEFFYPNARFPILRANPDMGTRLHVTADSLLRQYSLVSDIKIRSGEIFYFERSFYIRSGTLTFRENEMRFAPRLTARAEVRDRTEDGPVTISMLVDNAPLLSFTARFESTPSLSQMEILALLGQSLSGSQLNESTDPVQRAFFSSVSDFAAQFYVIRQLERQIRNFTRLDMFSVRTQVIQNAVFMASGLMQTPVDRMSGVGNYFDNTTVFGGKYIGQDMFVQGMLSMRYDANKASLVTIAPDIGVELHNPLFSIRWDFVPTHPENWYVNDNSITLTWSRTF